VGNVVPVLLATPACAQERDLLHSLFSESGWKIHQPQTFREVLTAAGDQHVFLPPPRRNEQ
jgi:hypothetical protein